MLEGDTWPRCGAREGWGAGEPAYEGVLAARMGALPKVESAQAVPVMAR